MRLEGSCHCGAVRFAMKTHTPYPYMRCYCSICRKTGGGGGYAINLKAAADSLDVPGVNDTGNQQIGIEFPGQFCGIAKSTLGIAAETNGYHVGMNPLHALTPFF